MPVPSEANRLKLPPSETAKFTLALALLLYRAASKEAAAPNTQKLSTVVFQTPPLSLRRSSSLVTVRLPLPAKRFTAKVASNDPSAVRILSPPPTRSLNLPLKIKARLGGMTPAPLRGRDASPPPVRFTLPKNVSAEVGLNRTVIV